uniref:Lysine-specific histone demethylase 1B-like n=1 Tax=Actinia tenebrosa TaxID=6105 RepID=A0A6P8I5S2_ACTTE
MGNTNYRPFDLGSCAELSNGCTGDGYTSRWYHISNGEHFCNACFDHMYRSHKDGYEAYAKWKFEWGGYCQREASTKTYVAETVMAYWVKCKKCGKWRSLPRTEGDLTPDLAKEWSCKSFTTSKKAKAKGPHPCDLPEDERVSGASTPGWLLSLFEPPLLKNSPATQYLKTYFPDGVGLSPVLNDDKEKIETNTNGSCSTGYLQPFYNPDIGESAFTFRPDTMEQEEEAYFPHFASTREASIIYLTLRNLILALWASGCKECLTKDKVADNIITRGLVRIPLIQEAENILRYLSIKGIVNHGIIDNIESSLSDQKLSVIVIGAGASGLSAARHLSKFGVKVTVLEARNRIGGRVSDDLSLGCCVGKGAQILTGCINNPISVLCEQLGLSMKHISGHCDLLDNKGQAADISVDKKVEFHFNSILDAIAEWRKGKTEDMPLEDRIQEMHKIFLEETQIEFSE